MINQWVFIIMALLNIIAVLASVLIGYKMGYSTKTGEQTKIPDFDITSIIHPDVLSKLQGEDKIQAAEDKDNPSFY